jgi:hypothetical protein
MMKNKEKRNFYLSGQLAKMLTIAIETETFVITLNGFFCSILFAVSFSAIGCVSFFAAAFSAGEMLSVDG